jgi:quercetin dioxygenase-like cupin family protein
VVVEGATHTTEKEQDMRRTLMGLVIAGSTAAAIYSAVPAQATPPSGFTGTTVAVGRFGEFQVLNTQATPQSRAPEDDEAGLWLSLQKTKGQSDVYVQNNVWTPGGSTGWHTHPGHSLIIVTAGAVTVYESSDPSCSPHVYTQGMGFVDAGGNHVHLIRNEGAVDAHTIAVQLIPAGATRRVEAAPPASCIR